MFDYKIFGKAPIKVVLVHGGPGAINSMDDLGLMLAKKTGVLAINQTKFTINELVDEMNDIIATTCSEPQVLVGHSWGAWLIGLYAAKYPQLVRKLVLVGSGSFDENYIKSFHLTRMGRLTSTERNYFDQMMHQLTTGDTREKNEAMRGFGTLMGKVDTYQYCNDHNPPVSKGNFLMYDNIWTQASALRRSGELLNTFKGLRVPIDIIQGDYDSHALKGITEPFNKAEINYNYHLLSKCGHYPWHEKFAKDEFLALVESLIDN